MVVAERRLRVRCPAAVVVMMVIVSAVHG
jgi:hypothetical protein